MTFSKLGVHELLQKSIDKLGYTQATEIQCLAIPKVNEGHDIVALAQTGTGKTAAYLLPILSKLLENPVDRKQLYQSPRVLVLVPTRELAHQVQQACLECCSCVDKFRSIVITGGVPFHRHKSKLNSSIDILIGTPGRVLDYTNRKKINFDNIDFLVLDEADRMLDMGFSKDVEQIVEALPKNRQTLLFSATTNKKIESLYQRFMKSPQLIKTQESQHKKEKIIQKYQYVSHQKDKQKALDIIMGDDTIDQLIVFTRTKRSAEQVANELCQRGHDADVLHGDMQQRLRNKVLNKFKSKEIKLLVGTDILGRGIDIPSVSHVINYDIPKEPEDYVHRVGRTGRADSTGEAITLIHTQERKEHRKIEEYIGHKLENLELDGFPVDLPDKQSKGPKRRFNRKRRPVGRRARR